MSDREQENEKRDTIADIVAQIRAAAYIQNADTPKSVLRFADRIEAAWKRDEERAVEHATRHAEAVARDNCRDCVRNPDGKNYEGGNAAAMREAIVAFVRAYEMDNELDNIEATSEAYEKARAALSEPPRNCDVGTAEEQAQRYDQFCEENECSMCPVHAKWRQHFDVCKHEHISCGLIWAQMPYGAHEGGAK